MNSRSCLVIFFISICACSLHAQPAFKIIPLGIKGGIDESNLSSYMLAAEGTDEYVCLDAGTLHVGIQKAIDSGLFNADARTVLRTYIKGYLISHGHLDH